MHGCDFLSNREPSPCRHEKPRADSNEHGRSRCAIGSKCVSASVTHAPGVARLLRRSCDAIALRVRMIHVHVCPYFDAKAHDLCRSYLVRAYHGLCMLYGMRAQPTLAHGCHMARRSIALMPGRSREAHGPIRLTCHHTRTRGLFKRDAIFCDLRPCSHRACSRSNACQNASHTRF